MEAVILIGIQGSGKSTFYRELFFDTHVRISLDLLKTRHREEALLRTCLEMRQPFVLDNTNVRMLERARYISAARAAGFRVKGYFVDVALRDALWRNRQRTGRAVIPVPGVIGTFKRLEPPSLGEGFDELYVVSHGEGGRFRIVPVTTAAIPPRAEESGETATGTGQG
jgi:hypothetical protein